MRARTLGIAAAVAACAVTLTGCGRGSDSGSAQAAGGDTPSAQAISSGPAKGTVTVWAMGTEGEKLGDFAKAFEKDNPDVTIKVTPIPWDSAHDKLSTAIAGGQAPDVSLVGTTWMGEFAKTGALDATPPGIDKSAFFDGPWGSTVVDGTSYGVPWYVETRVIYYRKDLADKAGLKKPQTWDDLQAFAKGMKSTAGAKWGINLQPGGTGAWQTFMPFAWQAGASIVDDSGKKFTLDSPQMVDALKYYASFFKEGLAPTALPSGALESDFVKGSMGAFVSGPWHVGILQDQGGKGFLDKVGLATMPSKGSADASKPGTSFVGGGDLVVFKKAQNRDAAWKFVKWLTDPKTQVKWYQTVNDLPSVKSAWDDPSLSGDPQISVFGTQLNNTKSPPAIATWEQIANVIDTELEKVTKGGESPEAAAKAMQSKATSIGTGS